MRSTPFRWFERPPPLPKGLRLAVLALLAVIVLVGALLPPEQVPDEILHLLLLAAVLLAAGGFGLAAGLGGATLCFGLLLWRGLEPAAGGWSLGWRPVLGAFAWFAVAKLAAAAVAVPRTLNRRLAAEHRQARDEARRNGLLLEEWSHRVSNDLYLQVSMLRAQAGEEPGAAPALRAAAGRVQVLGRVHGRLSRGASGTAVDSRSFLEGLMADLRASLDRRSVTLALTAESHTLPLAAACDVGLVLNELVTNAVKHAFPANRVGAVRATFRRDGDVMELAVSDNGVGMPAGRAGGGVGGQLLHGLAAQLGGRLDTAAGEVGGTARTLRFPVPADGDARAEGAGMAINGRAPAVAPREASGRTG